MARFTVKRFSFVIVLVLIVSQVLGAISGCAPKTPPTTDVPSVDKIDELRTMVREYVDSKISDGEYEEGVKEYEYNQPYDKESLFYRRIFDKYYGGNEKTIPYYWRHPFSTIKDPSARLLDTY